MPYVPIECTLKDYASALLKFYVDSHDDTMGTSLQLADDIKRLLVDKYHASESNCNDY